MSSQALFVVRNGDDLCKKEDSPEGRLGRSIITLTGDQGAKDGLARPYREY